MGNIYNCRFNSICVLAGRKFQLNSPSRGFIHTFNPQRKVNKISSIIYSPISLPVELYILSRRPNLHSNLPNEQVTVNQLPIYTQRIILRLFHDEFARCVWYSVLAATSTTRTARCSKFSELHHVNFNLCFD